MKNKLLIGFTAGFLIAFIGELLINPAEGRFWAQIILLLIGAVIITATWYFGKDSEPE